MESFSQEVVSDQHEELLLRKGDPRLGDHIRPLQTSQRDVGPHEERLPGHSLRQLGSISAETNVLASFVLQHRLLHQLER